MKLLVSTFLSSLIPISGLMAISFLFFLIFAVLGVTFLSGATHYRCRETEFPINGDWLPVLNDTEVCGSARDCAIGYCGSLL
jgi:hypothetical protein